MTSTPVSMRLDEKLEAQAKKLASRQAKSFTDFVEGAIREQLAKACPTCGAERPTVAPGLMPAFGEWASARKGQVIYVVRNQNGLVEAFKGKLLSKLTDSEVELHAMSSNWNRGTFKILRAFIVHWAEGDWSESVREFEDRYPGIKVNWWGMTSREPKD